jgi:DNA-binding SARP family transcriptional activator/tetratricopeptide (TPR) repeat protein
VAQLRLLGSVTLWSDGRPVDLGPPKQRAVLAALAIDARRPVSVDTLVHRVWDDQPPTEARNALYAHVMRIRRALASASAGGPEPLRLERTNAGYLLHAPDGSVDLLHFRQLLSQALDSGTGGTEQAAVLDKALALWQGTPLADLSGSWVDRIRDTLTQQYLDALTAWGRAHLHLGHHHAVIDRLRDHADQHPTAEPLTAVLMRALHAAGRTAEALDRYSTIRRVLIQELGAEPSADLQHLHQAMLRGGPRSGPPPANRVQAAVVPRQLPPTVADFIGRDAELVAIARALDPGPAPALVVVSGMGGVGKTTLAVRAAWHALPRYPGGALYADLLGTRDTPADPHTVLGSFLRALGVGPTAVPQDPQERVGLFRSLTADRPLLVGLDDARDEAQVRPLLPADPACAAIVTARPPLAGLDGATHVPLAELAPPTSAGLLDALAGAARMAASPRDRDRLVSLCGGLPLALRIAGLRLVLHPQLTVRSLADELAEQGQRLDALNAGDRSVRASFALSYGRLRPAAATMLRRLGDFPGTDIGEPATVALAGRTAAQVRRDLDDLHATALVQADGDDGQTRYRLHDLIRVFAAERSAATDGPAADDAVRRVLDWYIATALAAKKLLTGRVWEGARPDSAPAGVPRFRTYTDVLAWFEREHTNLLALLNSAHQRGWSTQTWRLAAGLHSLHLRAQRIDGWTESLELAVAAAQADQNRAAEIRLRADLGSANFMLERLDEAEAQWTTATRLSRAEGEIAETARSQDNLGLLYWHRGEPARAEEYHLRALHTPEFMTDASDAAAVHLHLGIVRGQLGRYDEAAHNFARAIDHASAAGNWLFVCYVHHNAAELATLRSRQDEARTHAQAEIDLAREAKIPLRQARGLHLLGDSLAQHDPARARDAWREAIAIYDQLRNPLGDTLRARLTADIYTVPDAR